MRNFLFSLAVFFVASSSFASEQYELLNAAIKQVSMGKGIAVQAALHGLCVAESSKQVRKYQPWVKQNMDYLGSHNVVQFKELRFEGFITDAKRWQDSRQWLAWRKFFQDRPDIGTIYAARWFCRLVKWHGLNGAIEMWKTGTTGTIAGIEYRMNVHCFGDSWWKASYRGNSRGKIFRRVS